jgi:hypothetical protein
MHAYLAVGRYEDAIRTADLARRGGGSPTTAVPVRAFASQQLGDLPQAIAAWRVAITHTNPVPWRFHGFLARARAAAGYEEAALAGLDSARVSVTDTAGITRLDSVERAVRDGCYRRTADVLVPDSTPLPPDRPLGFECDQLGHWFIYILAGQNANVSQNARNGRSEPVGATPAVVP